MNGAGTDRPTMSSMATRMERYPRTLVSADCGEATMRHDYDGFSGVELIDYIGLRPTNSSLTGPDAQPHPTQLLSLKPAAQSLNGPL